MCIFALSIWNVFVHHVIAFLLLLLLLLSTHQQLQGLCTFPFQTESAGKKTPKNRDIGAMFKSASNQTPATKVLLEERTVRDAISAHAASDCDLLYRSHAEKVFL